MGTEIERKFLLRDETWRAVIESSKPMRQGYLRGARLGSRSGGPNASVRVRIAGVQAWLTIKQGIAGAERAEFEYPIPCADAEEMLAMLCGGALEKTRHRVRAGRTLFEVDEFAGENTGLIVAEVELPAVDATFSRPPWLGPEVTALRRYYNAALVGHPWCRWSVAERAAGDAAC